MNRYRRRGLTAFLALWAGVSAGHPDPVSNAFLRVEFDPARTGQVNAVVWLPDRIRIPVRASEAVVCDEGSTRPVEGFTAVPDAAPGASRSFEAALPANPLLGRAPGNRIELPFFRQSDTTKLRLTKTIAVDASAPVLEIRYAVRNTDRRPIAFCLKMERDCFDRDARRIWMPTAEGVRGEEAMAYEYDTPAAWIGFSAGPFSAAAEFDPVSLSCLARPVGTAPGAAVSTVITLAPDAVWQTVTRLHFASAMPGVSGVSGGLMAGIALPSPPAISRRNQPDLIAAEGWEDGTDGGLLAELGSETESIDNRIDHLLQTPPQLVRNAFLPGKPVSFALHLAARQAWTGRIAGEVVRRPGANPVSLGPKTVTVTPGRTAVIPFTFTPDRAGTWVIRFREGNDRSPLVEIPVTVDKPSGLYLADSLAVPRDGVEFSRYRMERWREPGRFDPHSLAFPVTASIPSPHTAYAKPLAGGPLRLLACFPFITGRKAVELMQRLDCRPDVVLIGGHGYAESTTSPQEAAGLRAPADEVRAMKRALLRKPEVILLAGVVWNYFPDEIRRELLRQTAEEGVPLILAGAINLPPVFRQAYGRNPKPGDTLDASGSLGRGTIRFFSEMAPGGLMRPEFLDSEREWEALCHDLVRLGRGEPSLRVEPPRFAADPGTGIVVVENRGPAPFRGRLELAIRRETGLRDSVYGVTVFPEYADAGVVTRPLSLGPGATNRIVFALPASPPGKERVFAIIRDEQGAVVDWTSDGRSLRSAYRIEGFETLPAAAHSPLRLCRDDDMRIRFRWAGGALEGPVDLEARGVDVAGRELFRVRRAVSGLRNGEPVEMVAPLRRAVRSLLVAQVAVSQGGRVLVEARRKAPVFLADRRSAFRFRQLDNENWFPFTERTIDDFVGSRAGFEQFDIEPHAFGNVFAVPGGPTREEQERLRRAESLLQGAPSAPEADLDFRRSSRLDEVEALVRQGGSGKKAASPIRSPCFHDPDFRAFQKTAVRGLAADPRCPQQVLAVDEFVYGLNACRCDRCARAFSAFLQSGYGDLARLNAEWQTAFRGWDEARLYGIESDFPVPRDADWPRVLDTWMFKAAQHAAFVAELEAEGRAVDPDFAMGYSGTYKMSPFNGLDLFAMAKAGRIHGVYRDNLEWMSFAGPAAVFGWQSGYGAMYNPAHEAARPWELLAAGQSGIGNFTCPAYPMAGPDGSLHEGPRRFFENFDQVRRGPAALLLDCRCYDPVAIYFSSPSFFVHALEWWRESKPRETFKPDVGNGGSVNDWPRRASHLIAGLAAGHQVSPYYVGYGDVAAGAWGPIGKPRILVLPYTPALSREEASRLAAFVREGGLLIGTVNAATRSEHGAPLARPLLDEVFGVRRARPVPFPTLRENAADLRTRARFRLPGMDADLAFTPSVVGPPAALEAVTATVHGRWGEGQTGGPIVLVNRYGKGLAVELNFLVVDLEPITGLRPDPSGRRALDAILGWAIAQAGIRPFSMAVAPEERRRPTLSRFQDGDNQYVAAAIPSGFPPDPDPAIRGEIALREPRWITDLRAGTALGRAARFAPSFEGRTVAVYACLPYAVRALRIQAPARARQGDILRCPAELDTDGGPIGRHVFRVDCLAPDGRRDAALGYNAEAPGGRAEIEVPLACNEQTGTWTLRVRDVATGVTGEARVEVKGRAEELP